MNPAFTLVEMLACVTVISILITMATLGYERVVKSGWRAREMTAGRTLIAAYLSAAADNDGRLMVGNYEGRTSGLQNVSIPGGDAISGAMLSRYPYRLAPYFGYAIDGVILTNQNKAKIPKLFKGGMLKYGISLCPAFGINYYFVGGYSVDDEIAGRNDCATNLSQVSKPSSLLVFATAFQEVSGERIEGRFGVEPPSYRTALWDQNLHVDARHDGKALCAFLDGSVRGYTIDELRDMRLWSKNAAEKNDRSYTVAAEGSSGIPGGSNGRR